MTLELARKRAEEIAWSTSDYRPGESPREDGYRAELTKQILALAADVAEACAPKRLASNQIDHTHKVRISSSNESAEITVVTDGHSFNAAIDDMHRAASLYREASK